jgi:hypothetical protein
MCKKLLQSAALLFFIVKAAGALPSFALSRSLRVTTVYMDTMESQYLNRKGKTGKKKAASCTLQFLGIYMNISMRHII